jgi:hypothetical protein
MRDPDEFMNRLLSSPEQTWHIPEHAVITPGPDRGTSLLDGAVITWWADE